MPYVHTKLKIKEKDDKRIKLTKSQKSEIYSLYNLYGAFSQRELAKMFGVSRRLITFIVEPQKQVENLKRRNEAGGSKQYYDKDKWREQMKSHRHHKQELYVKGELE